MSARAAGTDGQPISRGISAILVPTQAVDNARLIALPVRRDRYLGAGLSKDFPLPKLGSQANEIYDCMSKNCPIFLNLSYRPCNNTSGLVSVSSASWRSST